MTQPFQKWKVLPHGKLSQIDDNILSVVGEIHIKARRPGKVAGPVAFVTIKPVVPAKAGTQWRSSKRHWIPAFAGMTNGRTYPFCNLLTSARPSTSSPAIATF